MKKAIHILITILAVLGFTQCSDENQPARTPVASATVSATQLEINQSMKILFTGIADQVVVYTGDNSHNYALRDSSNTGYVMNKTEFTYSYSTPGTFHVVILATTYDTYLGKGLRTDSISFDVTVVDDNVDINEVYSYINPNTYYAEAMNDVDWVMRVPTKQMYNNKEVTLNAKRQRLSFDINSDSTKIYVDDILYSSRTYYDLTATHQIHVVSNYGTTRDYRLYTLVYPELKTIKLNGVTAKQLRDAYYQDLLTYSVNLPSTSDLTKAIITFTLDSDVKMYAGSQEIHSGDAIDLTDASTSYTLVRTSTASSVATATTRIVFSATVE